MYKHTLTLTQVSVTHAVFVPHSILSWAHYILCLDLEAACGQIMLWQWPKDEGHPFPVGKISGSSLFLSFSGLEGPYSTSRLDDVVKLTKLSKALILMVIVYDSKRIQIKSPKRRGTGSLGDSMHIVPRVSDLFPLRWSHGGTERSRQRCGTTHAKRCQPEILAWALVSRVVWGTCHISTQCPWHWPQLLIFQASSSPPTPEKDRY